MPTPRFDLLAMGEPLLEFNQARPEEPAGYRQGFGGDTSNAAIAASRLGARAAYITRLGDDAFGRMFLELWRREGVDASGVGIDADAPTGIYFVTHGARGHEFSYLRSGTAASRMRPADLPLDLIRSAAALHASGISQAISASACDSVFAAIEAARSAGAKICYDSNLRLKLWPLARARAIITATMRLCDWFVPSLEEARQLSGVEDPQAILDWCHAEGAPVVDATGAGDCFDGAFVTRLIAGDAPVQAARYANAAAAMATTGYGAVAPLPRHADVAAFLAKAA